MQKALIEGATNNPGAPSDWNKEKEGSCGRLPIRVITDGSGKVVRCVSAWKPSALELGVLNDGGYVELHVVGWQVPVALSVTDRNGAQEI